MPSRAWVVTLLASCLMDLLLLFQCPHGLELLLIMDGMPVQRIRFNALSGLSCYNCYWQNCSCRASFNALSGLSCYDTSITVNPCTSLFQCPLGLELLRIEWRKGTGNTDVSMPSRAWVVTRIGDEDSAPSEFQCPLGLELLRQECPIF